MHEKIFPTTNPRIEMASFLPEKYQKVLEIGCGAGNFSENLRSGCEVWGVEPDSSAAKVAAEKISHVLIGKYSEVYNQLPDDYFNLVICNDVIEHMEDYNVFFSSIKDKMATHSCLVGSIPNIRHYGILYELLFKKDWRYQDCGALDKYHLRFFTEKSLKRILRENNFEIDLFTGINTRSKNFINHIIKTIIFNSILIPHYDCQFLQFGFRALPQ